ncbi:hypothetical protein BamIOP4010DRAFT_0615 [Burkholderia ambifaria IOP40-10]|uniref:Transmembrane protein n=1 Tax=Burkholderia ambifaria IOP40-10 TaxID=396596 RepID=B1F9A6_9BURK|nr:hypothetical protein [Burkholderia ambifaria]EDT05878.1 hypothetical protein BamIOP4010DRAFT_0615 [Burkholderia ambifaria IOP40-10]
MKRDQLEMLELQRASAIGPATGEQLQQWASEHDRVWDRKVRNRRILVAICLISLVGLTVASAWPWPWKNWTGLLRPIFFGLVATALWRAYRSPANERPFNPYLPIDLTPADLQDRNADFPVALAYLDAIRHQRRSIVPHDLDVLAMVRQQQQFNQGA